MRLSGQSGISGQQVRGSKPVRSGLRLTQEELEVSNFKQANVGAPLKDIEPQAH